nr:hypothetical protein [Tanacetum cinerariifolium]
MVEESMDSLGIDGHWLDIRVTIGREEERSTTELLATSCEGKDKTTFRTFLLKKEKAQSSISVSTEGKRKGHSLFPSGRASKRLHYVKLQASDWLQGTLEEEQ